MFTQKLGGLQKLMSLLSSLAFITLAVPPLPLQAAPMPMPMPIEPCLYADPATSDLAVSATEVLANGKAVSAVTVTLRNAAECGAKVVTASTFVSLNSSRAATDNIVLAPGATNPTTTGQVTFWVSTYTPGTSTYWAEIKTLGTSVALQANTDVFFYSCVTGFALPLDAKSKYLQFRITNPASSAWTWRLSELTLDWATGNGQKLEAVSLGPTGSIWTDMANVGYMTPLTLGPATEGATGWNDNDRDLWVNSTETLKFTFLKELNVGRYAVTLTFEDPTGQQVCSMTLNATR